MGADIWDYAGAVVGQNNVPTPGDRGEQIRGDVRYELTDHLGNVRSVITDRKLPTQNGGGVDYAPDVVSAQDYYPFGMLMPGRQYANASFTSNGYRFGFNGIEMDDEVSGKGNSYTTTYRQYDSRLGRWFSIDPKGTAFVSPYVSMSNNPILYSDPLGDTIKFSSPDAEALYNSYLSLVKSKAVYYGNIVNELMAKKDATTDKKQIAKLDKKIIDASADLATYNGILSELEELESSSDIFRIRTGLDVSSKSRGGTIRYNSLSTEIDINISYSRGGYESHVQVLSHELLHAYQFTQGDIVFGSSGLGAGLKIAYDKTDEYAAYRRQNLFAVNFSDPSYIRSVKSHVDGKGIYRGLSNKPLSVYVSTTYFSIDAQNQTFYLQHYMDYLKHGEITQQVIYPGYNKAIQDAKVDRANGVNRFDNGR